MSRNGSGVYTPPAASYPAVSGTLIEAAKFNAVIDDVATALTESVAINGQTAMTGDLPMGSHKITGLSDGVAASDACAYGQAGAAAIAGTYAATSKATPVDADVLPLSDSAASFGLKKLTWANLKATLGSWLQAQTATAFTTGGTSTAFTLTPTPALTALAAGQRFRVKFNATAGATPTLAISGLTATALKLYDSSGAKVAASATTIIGGMLTDVEYDGTDMVILNPLPPAVVAPSGVLQRVEATPYVTYTSTATIIPLDDTIPQIAEGVEYLTATITPSNAANRLRVTAYAPVLTGSVAAMSAIAALFQDATADALAVSHMSFGNSGSTNGSSLTLTHEMAAGTTSATTFRLRLGPSTGTLYINGSSSARFFGGIGAMRLTVEEFAP